MKCSVTGAILGTASIQNPGDDDDEAGVGEDERSIMTSPVRHVVVIAGPAHPDTTVCKSATVTLDARAVNLRHADPGDYQSPLGGSVTETAMVKTKLSQSGPPMDCCRIQRHGSTSTSGIPDHRLLHRFLHGRKLAPAAAIRLTVNAEGGREPSQSVRHQLDGARLERPRRRSRSATSCPPSC